MRGILIEIIVDKRLIQTVVATPPVVGLLVLGAVELLLEREVHDGLEIGVFRRCGGAGVRGCEITFCILTFTTLMSILAPTLLRTFAPPRHHQPGILLPRGGVGRIGHPSLADHVEVGILLVERLHPAGHSAFEGVGIGVHADAVDTDGLYPPDAVLDEIVHHIGVVLVQVGHGRDKPSLHRLTLVHLAGIRVAHRCQLIASLQEAGTARIAGATRLLEPVFQVEPVVAGHIGHPRMLEAAMVEDHVHHNLQSLLMGLVGQTAILFVGAEARIDAIVVGRGIAVIGGELKLVGRVVLEDGREP